MIRMKHFGAAPSLRLCPIIVAMMLPTGCSRQIEVPIDDSTAQAAHAPFREVDSNSADAAAPTSSESSPNESSLPFRPQDLPAGTLLSVRLGAPIPAIKSDSFEGSIDEPVVFRGKTVIARGTPVSGRVEFASPSTVKPERSFVRLVLTSIRISETDVTVRSASLFARHHNPDDPANPVIRLEKGHRLTFRLVEPLYFVTQTAQVSP